MKFKLIMAFVKPNITDKVVDAMKRKGATGATIIPARGTGVHEAKSFFGLSIEDQTDILVLEHAVGLGSQMKIFKDQARDDYF
jgi:nitrogen regulatory protein PII